ncbi:MAG: hypothetical protein IIY74_01005 [Firmicutes bacterium]|nr:hypothetical protein [Bacillota bacterium]
MNTPIYIRSNKYTIINGEVFDTMIAGYLTNYDVKDDISIIGRSFGYKINDYLEDYGSIKRPIDVGLDKLKEIIGTKAKFIYESRDDLISKI